MITGTARSHRGSIEVRVRPGGALDGLSIGEQALALGPTRLAGAVLAAVDEATSRADAVARAEHPDVDAAALGIASPATAGHAGDGDDRVTSVRDLP